MYIILPYTRSQIQCFDVQQVALIPSHTTTSGGMLTQFREQLKNMINPSTRSQNHLFTIIYKTTF